jgi:sec-independent protein translocase protein TatC
MAIQQLPEAEPHLQPVGAYDGAEMTLIEHLKELRNRAIICCATLVFTTALCFWQWETIYGWLIAPAPTQDGQAFQVASFTPLDRIGVLFKIGLYGGLILASPMFIYHALAFIIPGLTPKERRILLPSLLGVIGFLLLGMAFAYWIILPRSLDFLLGLGGDKIVDVQGVKQYMDFVTRIIFWVGISFELPMVLAVLARLGVVSWRQLIKFWRYAFVGVFVVAAVITPTPDPLTQSMVAGPMFFLYVVGIFMAWAAGRGRTRVRVRPAT